MRALFTTLTAVLVCLLGLPAPGHAAPRPLGSGAVLFDPIGPAAQRCTAAFAATDGLRGYLVAGPACTGGTLYTTVDGAMVLVGPVVSTASPYRGYSIVQVTNLTDWTLVPWVEAGGTRIVITGSRETPVGGRVCLADARSGLRCGVVTATGQTVTFPWGTASGLTRTSICVGTRELGSAYLTDDQAQGVPLGGPDFCTGTGPSYFVPVNRILTAHGLRLVTG